MGFVHVKSSSKLLYVLAAFCLSTVSSSAVTGNDLLDVCTSGNARYNDSECIGFINGMSHGIWMGAREVLGKQGYVKHEEFQKEYNAYIGYCFPKNVTTKQVTDVYRTYLKDQPSVRHKPANLLFLDAMRDAFSCKQ